MTVEGFDPPQPPLIMGENEILVKSLEMIAAGESREAIYEYWRANLDCLKNENLLMILEQYAQAKLSSLTGKSAYWFADNLYNFNIYIQEFPLGSIAINQELSIKSCELALTVFTFQHYPEDWANTQICLGVAYWKRIKGERADNLETAIACYQEALKVYTSTTFPYYWAMTQMNLGSGYLERIRGERADNLENAIACYQEALKVYTFTTFPFDWARTQGNLGNAYQNRIREERADNLETAIACYQEALKVYTVTAFPFDWARTQGNLGTAYGERIKGERADNLENAIACYQEALKFRTFDAFPYYWAMTQICMGNAYSNRIRGERADNLETAIACYQEALKVYTFTAFPFDWARTQMNLGNAYLKRIRGEQADNLETAIACYQEALKVYTFEAFPQDWAWTQGCLAYALMDKALLIDNLQDLDQAINLYRQSLQVAVPGTVYFINFQYNLGNALARRYETSKNPDDLQQSLAAYQIALDYLSPEHCDRQQFWQAIPATQAILGSRLVRDGNWQEGLKLLVNSLNQLKIGDNSLVYANALYQTGYAYEVLSDWENARLYYRDALRLYDHLKDLAGIAKSREGLGGVFVSQGYLEKGMNELAQARELYQQLNQIEKSNRVEHLYQVAQRAQEKQKEVMV